jgi:hypothetical protein
VVLSLPVPSSASSSSSSSTPTVCKPPPGKRSAPVSRRGWPLLPPLACGHRR